MSWKRVRRVLAIVIVPFVLAACQPTAQSGGGRGVVPFLVLRNQPIPEEGVLSTQFRAAGGVRLRVTVDGPRSSAPDFQLVVGEYRPEDFGSIPDGDIQIDTAGSRRAGFAQDTFDTVIEGIYTLFVIDDNDVAGAAFNIEIS